MTTMALTEPPLKRLFDRLDFAPQPKRPELQLVHERWEAARDGAVAPQEEAPSAFRRKIAAQLRPSSCIDSTGRATTAF